jgi:potassium efflux system protein
MRTLRNLLICVVGSAVWPGYLGLAAFAAWQGPWPRAAGAPLAAALSAAALAAFTSNLLRWLLGRGGWAEDVLAMPEPVTRQVRDAALSLIGFGVAIGLPAGLLDLGLIAVDGRPIAAPAVVRCLILAYEIAVLGVAWWTLRRGSPLVAWLADAPPAALEGLARNRRAASAAVLAGIAGVIVLDALGFSYSARRLSTGAAGSAAVAAVCWGLYRVLLRVVDDHAWRWIRVGHAFSRRHEPEQDSGAPDDLAGRLRLLSAYLAAALGLFVAAWVWGVDLAFFRFISEQSLWKYGVELVDAKETSAYVTVGELTRAVVVFGLTIFAWRNLSTFFAVAVFPRMPDDPGVRFAVVTLCRYAVLGVGVLASLSAVHLGIEKIGMVLAALGVGLGFGLQEIVSNFVCGVILLLERPIRVGDIVTVSGMNGKVDRINIRATTIINGDNQSFIVPNRAFVTGDLVNWTLKDKIIRVGVKVKAAYGSDPDVVSELLLSIAREDHEVLTNPAPAALVEDMTDSGLAFTLSVYVADPGFAGRVKHRLVREIQLRFASSGVSLPVPTQKLLVDPRDLSDLRPDAILRADAASPTPPAPWSMASQSRTATVPAPADDCHRGVDR